MSVTRTTPAQAGTADREQALTDEVVASFAGAASPRLREVLAALVRALHGVAREVRLTQQEWETAIAFLTRCGEMTDDRRQEFVLLSDVLGLSMLTVGINAPADPRATEATVFGPFFTPDSPEVPLGGDVAGGAPGQPCWVEGQVTSTDGRPVGGALLEVWEADEDGLYDLQHTDRRTYGRAHLYADADGGFRFWAVRPTPYPIPDDGPVGELLAAAGRSPMRPAHVHFRVSAPGSRTLVTHVFADGGPHLDSDAVFGVRESLVVPVPEQPPGTGPDGRRLDVPWSRLVFDVVLAPETAPPAVPSPQSGESS